MDILEAKSVLKKLIFDIAGVIGSIETIKFLEMIIMKLRKEESDEL